MEKILISDAAKQVEVESHVLRYWEEELHLPIQRNKQGHRYYTTEDVNRFKQIKNMKEQGFQLKAIRSALDGSLAGMGSTKKEADTAAAEVKKTAGHKASAGQSKKQEKNTAGQACATTAKKNVNAPVQSLKGESEIVTVMQDTEIAEQDKAGKAARLQFLLQHMIAEAVHENNEQLCENVKQVVAKEMDFQFRQQDEKEQEREAERLKREEEHYRQLDTLLRGKNKRESRKDRRKKAFSLQKQPLQKQPD